VVQSPNLLLEELYIHKKRKTLKIILPISVIRAEVIGISVKTPLFTGRTNHPQNSISQEEMLFCY